MKTLIQTSEEQQSQYERLKTNYQLLQIAHEKLKEECKDKYESLYNILPIAISENDFSLVKQYFDSLTASGVKDFKQYFKNKKDKRGVVLKLMKLVKIVDLNQAHYMQYGILKEEYALLWPSILATYSNELIEEYINQFIALAEGKPYFEIEMPPLTTIYGITKNTISYLQIAPGFEHDMSRVFISYIDITDHKRFDPYVTKNEITLRDFCDDKDRFIQSLAHDIREPFNAILGFSELLTTDLHEYDAKKIDEFASIINNSAQKTFHLVEELILWTRAYSGKIPFEPQTLDFALVCNELIEHLQPHAKSKNITINPFLGNDTTVFADKKMIQTVLRNLISNAIKFTQHQGVITFQAHQNNTDITITVADNGVGMKPDVIKNLFNDTLITTTSGMVNETGTSIGLMLCKEYISKHGGDIWVETEEGKGNNFKFTLPLTN